MYRKRRKTSSADLQAIKEALKAELTHEVKEELRSEGLQIVPVFRDTSPAPVGRKSSCASTSELQVVDGPSPVKGNEDENPEIMIGWSDDGTHGEISLLTEPTPCAILHNVYRGGDYIPVASGQVYPKQTELHTVLVDVDNAVVKVERVLHNDFEDIKLSFPPNDEILTLKEAVLQRIEWSRRLIIVRPRQLSSPSLAKGSTKTAAKSSVAANSPSTPKSAARSCFKITSKKATRSPLKERAAAQASKSPSKEHAAAAKSAAGEGKRGDDAATSHIVDTRF
ncbi:unnamed protein product [Urochloa humidicola]